MSRRSTRRYLHVPERHGLEEVQLRVAPHGNAGGGAGAGPGRAWARGAGLPRRDVAAAAPEVAAPEQPPRHDARKCSAQPTSLQLHGAVIRADGPRGGRAHRPRGLQEAAWARGQRRRGRRRSMGSCTARPGEAAEARRMRRGRARLVGVPESLRAAVGPIPPLWTARRRPPRRQKTRVSAAAGERDIWWPAQRRGCRREASVDHLALRPALGRTEDRLGAVPPAQVDGARDLDRRSRRRRGMDLAESGGLASWACGRRARNAERDGAASREHESARGHRLGVDGISFAEIPSRPGVFCTVGSGGYGHDSIC